MPSYPALQAPLPMALTDPAAAGVSFTGGKGAVAITNPLMALLGEPLDAMVQNLGQTDNSYVSPCR